MVLQYNLPGTFPTIHEGQDLLPYTFLHSIPYDNTATVSQLNAILFLLRANSTQTDQQQYCQLPNSIPALEKLYTRPLPYPFNDMDTFSLGQVTGQYSDPHESMYSAMFSEELYYLDNTTQKAQGGLFSVSDNLLTSFSSDFSYSPLSPYNATQQWDANTNMVIESADIYQNSILCSNLLTAASVDMSSPETIISEEDYTSPSNLPQPTLMEEGAVSIEEASQKPKLVRKQLRSKNGNQRATRAGSSRKAARASASGLTRRATEDRILIECKEKGMTFPEIMKAHDFKVAESTLRGRYRALIKNPSERPRKPEWSAHQVR